MPPTPTSGELWGTHIMPESVEVECLLPTGIVVSLQTLRNLPLKEVKDSVWNEARLQPLFDLLVDREAYILVGLTQNGEEEEFYDESRRLCDLRLAFLALRVVLPEGNKTENLLNGEISQCIGMQVSDLTRMAKTREVATFRRSLLDLSASNWKLLEGNLERQASYMFSAGREEKLVVTVKTALQSVEYIHFYVVGGEESSSSQQKHTIQLNKTDTVRDALVYILRKHYTRYRPSGAAGEDVESWTETNVALYALKLCCSMSFMMDLSSTLISYKHIQTCLVENRIPLVKAVLRSDVCEAVRRPAKFELPAYAYPPRPSLGEDSSVGGIGPEAYSLWNVNDYFSVFIKCGRYVRSKEPCRIYVRAAIYHGPQRLGCAKQTHEMPINNPVWNDKLDFQLYLPDIPRAARLCLALVQKSEKKSKVMEYPFGWVNINLFNYQDALVKGKMTLPLSPHSHNIDTNNFLNHEGQIFTPASNGSTGATSSDTAQLVLDFRDYHHSTIVFPSYDAVLAHGEDLRTDRPPEYHHNNLSQKETLGKIHEIAIRDPLSEILEQEKVFLWTNRELCRSQPQCLPRLAQSVKWSSRDDVALFHHLLNRWPIVPEQVALELLGVAYMDANLREFSVYCLDKKLSNTELIQYLLQLTQVLKFEPYLDNSLTHFLLRRALSDVDIGLAFFWYLRSEIHQSEVRMRFGVILEAFCRGCGPLLHELTKQTEALDKLAGVSEQIKREKEEDQKALFQKCLKETDIREAVENITSPLDKNHRLGRLVQDHCDIKKSKKRPLWLVWTNEDELSRMHITDYRLIFKHGDDLRQDMLTLQLIRIMDEIWKEEGMDMKLVPYSCLATGNEMGLIEAVRDAETVMSIQKKQFKSAIQMDPSQLHRWIKEGNPGEQYDRAIDTFTRSCAGYCVATFVLGIRDRHPDNIMLNKSGQLFHIDFGHFLNNRKKKFGINRERVPFVLTEDFVCVIARGADRPYKGKCLDNFMSQCGQAYLVLRRHANLFITLFTMMLHCGIPELTAVNDLEYLRKTLAVESTNEEALQYFNSKLGEAYSGAWTTKFDWFSHWVKN